MKDISEIKIIEFDHNDVVRHPLVSKIIRAYQKKSTDDKDATISNDSTWFKYLKNPDNFIKNKIKIFNKNLRNIKRMIFFVHYCYPRIKKLEN